MLAFFSWYMMLLSVVSFSIAVYFLSPMLLFINALPAGCTLTFFFKKVMSTCKTEKREH